MFMDTHCIFDFKYIQLLIGHIAPAEIPSLGNGRYLHIFPIGQRLSQIIFIDNILKRFSFFIGRRSRHFETQYRTQFIDGFLRSIGMIPVRFIHKDNQVIQRKEVIEI